MISLVVWTLVALGAAALVLVVAGARNGQHGGLRSFLRDLRAGLQERRTGRSAPSAVADAEPVDTTLDDLFASAEVADEAYLQVEDLTETLAWAREQATRASRVGRSVASRSAGLVRR